MSQTACSAESPYAPKGSLTTLRDPRTTVAALPPGSVSCAHFAVLSRARSGMTGSMKKLPAVITQTIAEVVFAMLGRMRFANYKIEEWSDSSCLLYRNAR